MCDKTQAMHDAIKVAEIFWDKYDNENKGNLFWNVFLAIIELTKDSPELAAEKANECYFSTTEMCKKFEELADKKEGFVDSSRLSKEYRTLGKHLEAVEVRFITIAIESGIRFIPVFTKDKNSGGQGKQTNYRLSYKKIETNNLESQPLIDEPKTRNINQIKYYVESTPKLLFWSNWLQNLNVEKYRYPIILFTASPIIVGLCAIVMFWVMVFGIGISFGWTVIGVCAIYITFFMMFFRYFITAIENNIALLPDWMLPLKLTSAVLQYELNEPGSRKQRLKKLSVKVYSAKCPICGHRIILKSKGLPFNKRLVGECDLNPMEHRYSFDFTNLQGKKIT